MMPHAPPDIIIATAVHVASIGPCAKSKRGVVIFGRNDAGLLEVYANAHNSPPWPFECSGTDACKKDCGRICVHAEQRAIMQMLRPDDVERALRVYQKRPELELVHVKVVDGKLVASPDGPSCDQCSKLIVEAGIRTVWLYCTDGAWSSWDASGFHQRTLRNLGLHDHL